MLAVEEGVSLSNEVSLLTFMRFQGQYKHKAVIKGGRAFIKEGRRQRRYTVHCTMYSVQLFIYLNFLAC
jgi:hypothetical protein